MCNITTTTSYVIHIAIALKRIMDIKYSTHDQATGIKYDFIRDLIFK